MATQKYRSRLDLTVGDNEGTSRPVHPARPELPVKAGAENKTPAPTAAPTTTADAARSTSWGRSMGNRGDNPGKNGYGGASSLNPGERAGAATINPMAPTDAVLDGLVRCGARGLDKGDDWQTRDLGDEGKVANHPHMKDANTGGAPSGRVPEKIGMAVFDPNSIRKPGQ